jgi:hypothetical protein
VWCDALSITVGLVDIIVVVAIGVAFVFIKVKPTSVEVVENAVVSVDGSRKKRRLSSRELMIEMSTQRLQTNITVGNGEEGGEGGGGEEGEGGGEGGGEVTVTLGINPMHAARGNTLKQATRTSQTSRKGGKQRMKRLSKVMKARQNESGGGAGNVSVRVF